MSLSREFAPTLEFSKKLIRVPSIADNPRALLQVLDMASERLQGFSYMPFVSNGIHSRLFYNTTELPKQFRVILNAHLDVVPVEPGNEHQFNPLEQVGRLYGRGSGDMKPAGAVQMDVFRELAHQVDYPLGLMLVTDEEDGGANGTGHQVAQGVRSDFVIAGEPTGLAICHTMKGRLGLQIVTNSGPAHAAYPERIDAATDEMTELLIDVRRLYPKPTSGNWQTTASVTDLNTSNSLNRRPRMISNTIPGQSSSDLDIRHIPEETTDEVLQKLNEVAGPNTEIEVFQTIPAAYTDPAHPDVKALQLAIRETTGRQPAFARRNGSCDFRWFTEVGNAGVALGPVAYNTHGEMEYVEIDSLVQYKEVLTRFLQTI